MKIWPSPSFISSFLRYLEIQIFLNLATLPLLIHWGLPFSVMTPVSNFIFNPFLFLILILSSVIFFCELIGIPNQWLVFLFECTTLYSQKVLSFGSSDFLIEFPRAHPLLLILIPISAVSVFRIKAFNTSVRRVASFIFLFFFFVLLIKMQPTPSEQSVTVIPFFEKNVYIAHNKGKTLIVDPGCLGSKQSALSWVEYTLVPHLIKTFGSSTIHHFITLRPTATTFQALHKLIECSRIESIYIPYWSQQENPHFNRCYMQLAKKAKTTPTIIHRLGYKAVLIELNGQICLITTDPNKKSSANLFPFLSVHLKTKIDAPSSLIIYPFDNQMHAA